VLAIRREIDAVLAAHRARLDVEGHHEFLARMRPVDEESRNPVDRNLEYERAAVHGASGKHRSRSARNIEMLTLVQA